MVTGMIGESAHVHKFFERVTKWCPLSFGFGLCILIIVANLSTCIWSWLREHSFIRRHNYVHKISSRQTGRVCIPLQHGWLFINITSFKYVSFVAWREVSRVMCFFGVMRELLIGAVISPAPCRLPGPSAARGPGGRHRHRWRPGLPLTPPCALAAPRVRSDCSLCISSLGSTVFYQFHLERRR